MIKQAVIYRSASGYAPYREYLDSLQDRRGAAKIKTRVRRAQMGNLGDHRSVGGGVVELRIDYGPGYRVYLAQHGDAVIVLLCAGDKHSQQKDIANAQTYWQDYKRTL
jgi:putative addiction module killer protein